jgi:chemotaxis protein histidine kinase CheA
MSGPAGFLEFFILEASDYVEQLDRLLLGGGSSGLDAEGVQRVARALRGTATMAKMPSFAELASSVERAGRAVQDGAVQWSPALSGVLVGAIDDLKALLHSTRNWSDADDRRAGARVRTFRRRARGGSSCAEQWRRLSRHRSDEHRRRRGARHHSRRRSGDGG